MSKLSKDGIFLFNERIVELLEAEPEVRLAIVDAMFNYKIYGEIPSNPFLRETFKKYQRDIDEGTKKREEIKEKKKKAALNRWEKDKGTEVKKPVRDKFANYEEEHKDKNIFEGLARKKE